MSNSLDDARVQAVLRRLFAERRAQRRRVLTHVVRSIGDRLRGHEPSLGEEVERLSGMYASVTPAQGRFLYEQARAARARRVVEYGTSVGISTLHLAAAVRDNGGGTVIGTELTPKKIEAARTNLTEAGLADLVEVREGNAVETLRSVEGPIDFVFLDGYPPLYQQILESLSPALSRGVIVIADNIFTHWNLLRGYRSFVRANGFRSKTLMMRLGVEHTTRI